MTKPYFLWDYDLSEKEVRRLLREGNDFTKAWLVSRILSHARIDDVFKYLTTKEILEMFPKLRMRDEIKKAWERAFFAWGYNVNS